MRGIFAHVVAVASHVVAVACCLQERFWFCMSPCNLRNPVLAAALLRFAEKFAAKEPVQPSVPWKDAVPQTSDELCDLEAAHQVWGRHAKGNIMHGVTRMKGRMEKACRQQKA